MSYMASGFMDGLFGGAKATLQIYGLYQQAQKTALEVDAADETKKQMLADKTEGAGKAIGADASSAIDVTVTPGSASAPAAPTADSAPAADPAKLDQHPDSSK